MVAIETTGSTKTNAPFSIGVPVNAGVLDSSHHLVATDGISGNPITCDETNRYSDLTPNVRGTTLSCVIPSLTSNTTDTIALTVASGAPGTGTDLTTANIVSAAGSGPSDLNSRAVWVDKASGNTYVASPLDALNSGNSTWVNISTATVMGKWRHGGGVVTGYILYAPLMHTGTPHPRLFVKYDVECYKAATTAYNSGTNPITLCQTDVSMANGVAQNASPADDEGSLTIGSTGTPTSCANFPTISPSYNLTLGANTGNAFTTGTASTGTPFTINTIGGVVDDGTGYGIIAGNPAPTSTVVNLGVVKPFAGTTLTNGGYKIYGIGHPYALRYTIRCNWSPSGTPPNLSVENGNLYLGNAWNNGTLTGGPAPYVIGSRAVLNYSPAASAITNTNPTTGMGNNPTGFFGGNIVGGGNGNGAAGSWPMFQEQSGTYDGVSPTPDTQIGALIRYDSNAAPAIFGNTAKFMLIPDHVIDNRTGLTPSMSGGTDWAFNPAFSGGAVNINLGVSSTSLSSWGNYPNTSHQPDNYYLPYVLSGDWKWLDNDIDLQMTMWASADPGFAGSQLKRIFLSGHAFFQARGDYHNWRNFGHLALILPDSDTNSTPSTVIGWTKDDAKTYLENQYVGVNSGTYLSVPANGTIIDLGTNGAGDPLCSGHTCNNNYLTPGPRWLELNGSSPLNWAGYQQHYGQVDAASLFETGMLSANGLKFWLWSAQELISLLTDSAEVPAIPGVTAYWWNGDGVTPVYSWAAQWGSTALQVYGNGTVNLAAPDFGRVPTGTLNLSATSGASITLTLPASGYLGAGAGYVGGYVFTSDGGVCKIIASPAPTATTVHCDTTATPGGHAFGSTSYTNTTWTSPVWGIPWALPGDTVGLEIAGAKNNWTNLIGNPLANPDYIQIAQAATIEICEYLTITGCPGAATTILGFSGGSMALYDPITWNIQHR